MPGRQITDRQMRLFMKFRQTETTPIAAAKAGFSTATGYRIEADPRLPSAKHPARSRRRPDLLEHLFEVEILPMLKAAPHLRSIQPTDANMRRPIEIDRGENHEPGEGENPRIGT